MEIMQQIPSVNLTTELKEYVAESTKQQKCCSAEIVKNFIREMRSAQSLGQTLFGDCFKKGSKLYVIKNNSSYENKELPFEVLSIYDENFYSNNRCFEMTESGNLKTKNGELYKKTKFPIIVIEIFKNGSKDNLGKLQEKCHSFNEDEKRLFDRTVMMVKNCSFRHQTTSDKVEDLEKGTVTLYSHDFLKRSEEFKVTHTEAADKDVGNTDNVFFVVNYGEGRSTEYLVDGDKDYGFIQLIFRNNDENKPKLKNGYMTLSDQGRVSGRTSLSTNYSLKKTAKGKIMVKVIEPMLFYYYKKQSRENYGTFDLRGDRYNKRKAMYTSKHMPEVIALNLIDFLRYLNKHVGSVSHDQRLPRHEFINYVFDSELSDENFIKVLYFMCSAEFHIPRILSTYDFEKYYHRNMRLLEAIELDKPEMVSNLFEDDDSLIKEAVRIFSSKPMYMEGVKDIIYMFVLRYIIEPNDELSHKDLFVVTDSLYSIFDNKENEMIDNIRRQDFINFNKALKNLKESIKKNNLMDKFCHNITKRLNADSHHMLLQFRFYNQEDKNTFPTLYTEHDFNIFLKKKNDDLSFIWHEDVKGFFPPV